MAKKYHYLKKDEIIRENDEVQRDNGQWAKTICVGQKAPDQTFQAHRKYRRLIATQ